MSSTKTKHKLTGGLWLVRSDQRGFHHYIIPIFAFVLLFGIIGTYLIVRPHAAPTYYLERMNVGGLCLDRSSTSANTLSWKCSNTDANQAWNLIPVGGNYMLQNKNSGQCVNDPGASVGTYTGNGSLYVWTHLNSHSCDSSTGVVFRNYGGAWLNPASHIQWKTSMTNGCINDPGSSTAEGNQLVMYPCNGTGLTTFSSSVWGSTSGGGSGGSCPSYGASSPSQAQAEAKCLMPQWGWSVGGYYNSLNNIWTHESGWVYNIYNHAGSGACGIPQFLPCGPKYSANSCNNFISNTTCQIKQGFEYIKAVYGDPNKAWAFWQVHHYYIITTDPGTGKTVDI